MNQEVLLSQSEPPCDLQEEQRQELETRMLRRPGFYSPELATTLSHFPVVAERHLAISEYYIQTGHQAAEVGEFAYDQEVAVPVRRTAKAIELIRVYRDTTNTLPHYLDPEAAEDIVLAITPVKKEEKREMALHMIRKALSVMEVCSWELQELKEYMANEHFAESNERYANLYAEIAAKFRALNIQLLEESLERRRKLQQK